MTEFVRVDDTETLEQVEARIAALYTALIRAELKAHHMREHEKHSE